MFQMVTSMYYMMTTLTSIGYGDIYAISILEKLVAIVIFLGG